MLAKRILFAFGLVVTSIVLYAVNTTFDLVPTALEKDWFSSEQTKANLIPNSTNCQEPVELGVKNIGTNQATIFWKDTNSSKWEYFVQYEGIGFPSGSGTSTTNKEVVVTQSQIGTNLQAGDAYEFYVRGSCDDGTFSDWSGPFIFRMECLPFKTIPFHETFDTGSATYDCWRIVDTKADSNDTGKVNTWEPSASTPKSGDRGMFFYGFNNPNDGWLISPPIQLTGDVYELTFWTKSSTFMGAELEVLLSENGTDLDSFKQVLFPKKSLLDGNFIQHSIYIHSITGNINIAWRIVNSGTAMLYLDEVKLEKVDCMIPEDVIVSNLQPNNVTFSWKDDFNSSWDYYVKPALPAGLPVGSGSSINSKTVTVNSTNGTGATALVPNTDYELYLRSTCDGTKKSKWVGPISFKTPCLVTPLPFWEGFNTDSTTSDCWIMVDNDKNATGTGLFVSGRWQKSTAKYEGNGGMYYSGGPSNDDWLISPTFNLDGTKKYRLKYFYKANASTKTDFDVLYATKGSAISDFTTVLLSKKGYNKDTWVEETLYISGVSGPLSLAWHVNTKNSNSNLYLDAVSLKEIDCAEPIDLNAKDISSNQVRIEWKDDFGSNWEYVVQESGGVLPKGKGTLSTTKGVTVKTDRFGKNLLPNTEYEFFVKTLCGGNDNSIWVGPYRFRTACVAADLPFWEGFNSNSSSIYCWTILDVNQDETMSNGIWVKQDKTPYEGNFCMRFSLYDAANTVESDDWLISPSFKFVAGKMYRLKYYYKVSPGYDKSEFEVVVSTTGVDPSDFKTVIVPQANYTNTTYQEKKVFITGLAGDVNLAWHVKGTGSKDIFIDHIFVEEVKGCQEPMSMSVENVEIHAADLVWVDDSGATKWDYFVQESGGPVPSSAGTSTTTKVNKITTDYQGNTLKGNTKYEYYVRSSCKDGNTSIWLGPFEFITLCDVYSPPFWEGFNKDSNSIRCWSAIDKDNKIVSVDTKWKQNPNVKYEGDQSIYYSSSSTIATNLNDWLVSPTFNLDGGMYVLKYHYRTNTLATAANEFEVLLSDSGIDATKFTTELVKKNKFMTDVFKEEVVFIDGVKGDVNIAWHINGLNAKSSYLILDNISLEKVDTCPEPYEVKTSNETSTGFDVEWKQYGSVTSWEVVVVKSGEPVTATPIFTQNVTGTPKTSISGLAAGAGYSIYVRAKCSDNISFSAWSTPGQGGTKIGGNDDCSGAINIPVNPTVDCIQVVQGSLLGATPSTTVKPSCATTMGVDVWFEFTALATGHLLSVSEFKSITGAANAIILAAIYDQPCGSLVNPLACTSLNTLTTTDWVLGDLVPGQKYYIRLGVSTSTKVVDFTFNLCLTTSKYTPLEVTPSGTAEEIEDLIKNVLIDSNCDLVSNVRYQNGDGSAKAMAYNTLGYFDKGGSTFPFDKGIVLSTNEIEYVSRPYMGYTADRGQNNERWVGDKDINEAIQNAGGGPKDIKRVTQIEFDFLAVKDSLKFEYLFASNSYHKTCGDACNVGALFAAWLVDLTTGEGINLAKVPETNLPIAINTIRNSTLTGANCPDVNPIYYDKHYDNVDKAIDAPIDFVGFTKPLSSETMIVVPGRSYHIKLAVIDFCPTVSHSSAVFFKAGSFDLGNPNLGKDLTIENGTALCEGASKVIESGISEDPTNIAISWFKDGKLIDGETKSNLTVTEAGNYSVVARYDNLSCEATGEIKIEYYPNLKTFIPEPTNIEVCRFSTAQTIVDLSVVELAMFVNTKREEFEVTYFSDAQLTKKILNPLAYEIDLTQTTIPIFMEVENIQMGCKDVFAFSIVLVKGDMPTKPADVVACESYSLPKLAEGQTYYLQSGGQGQAYSEGDVLGIGTYTMYVFQSNGNGCYEEVSYTIKVEEPIELPVFNDIYEECKLYVLPHLASNQQYEIERNGERVSAAAGDKIEQTDTKVYIITKSLNGVCESENSFMVYYADCPIPKGFSPNGDGVNDTFDLSEYGVTSLKIYNRNGVEVYSFQGNYTNQWKGQSNKGKNLISGTYYYVLTAFNNTKSGWVQLNR